MYRLANRLPYGQITRTQATEVPLRGAIVSASRLDLDPCQCTAASPRTGTPAAPGLLAPSRRCTSSNRLVSIKARSKVNSIRSCCARLPPMRSFCPASGASASIAPEKSRARTPRSRAPAREGMSRTGNAHLAPTPLFAEHGRRAPRHLPSRPGPGRRADRRAHCPAAAMHCWHTRTTRARRWPRDAARRVRNATRKPPRRKFSAVARRCAGRARWRPDTAGTPVTNCRPGFRTARDASSGDHLPRDVAHAVRRRQEPLVCPTMQDVAAVDDIRAVDARLLDPPPVRQHDRQSRHPVGRQ
jgi:hypothetical protein